MQLATLFATQTASAASTSQLAAVRVTPPGTFTAPFTVLGIEVPRAISYLVISFQVTPPSMPGAPSVITATIEVPIEIQALDANQAPFTINGVVFVPVSASIQLPPDFILRDLQALVTLGAATAVITSLTEITVTADYIFCFNAFRTEMVSLQAGLSACACNGIPVILGGP